MKATNTIEEALVGRTIKLSVIECVVLANLVNSLTGVMKEDRKQQWVETKDLENLRSFMMKVTGPDIISVDAVEEELFSPLTTLAEFEELAAVTSTVEANGNTKGEHRVGKIELNPDETC